MPMNMIITTHQYSVHNFQFHWKIYTGIKSQITSPVGGAPRRQVKCPFLLVFLFWQAANAGCWLYRIT